MKYKPSFVSLFLAFATFTPLAASAVTVTPVFTSAFEFGGETLVDVVYSDGSKSNIEAGRGLIVGGGANFEFGDEAHLPLQIQSTIGTKWTSTKQAKNGTVDWIRFPLEVFAFYKIESANLRLGGGPTYQFNNSLKGSQDAAVVSADFENSLGWALEGDYFFGADKKLSAGLRLTRISYQVKGTSLSAAGDSVGVNLSYFWF
jgi:hypothetical protein